MSETHTTLGEALLAFQAAPPAIHKTGRNPAFKGSKYVTLEDLMDAVLPALSAHGLVWATFPSQEAYGPALRYELRHAASGELMGDSMPLGISDAATPQVQGSAITYARRYALMAVLGLVGDEDDDGNSASEPRRPPVERPPAPPRLATDEERNRMIDAVKDAGLHLPSLLEQAGVVGGQDIDLGHLRRIKELLDEAALTV